MAYQAKRSKGLQEDFELVDESGEVAHVIHVSLDADSMLVNLNRKYTALTRALYEMQETKRKAETRQELSDCIEVIGRAMIDLLETVFGKENTMIIVDFYENRYDEMSREVLPFVSQVVIPRMHEIASENRKSILEKYNRKQRRSLLKGMK